MDLIAGGIKAKQSEEGRQLELYEAAAVIHVKPDSILAILTEGKIATISAKKEDQFLPLDVVWINLLFGVFKVAV